MKQIPKFSREVKSFQKSVAKKERAKAHTEKQIKPEFSQIAIDLLKELETIKPSSHYQFSNLEVENIKLCIRFAMQQHNNYVKAYTALVNVLDELNAYKSLIHERNQRI